MSVAWSTWDQMGMSRGHAGVTALQARVPRDVGRAGDAIAACADRARSESGHRRARSTSRLHPTSAGRRSSAGRAGHGLRGHRRSRHGRSRGRGAAGHRQVADRHDVRGDAGPCAATERRRTVDQSRLRPSGSSREHVAPATEWEQQVAAIWQDVLGGKPPSVDDHFFEAGGHSLLAMQVLARIKRAGTSICRCVSCSNCRPCGPGAASRAGNRGPCDAGRGRPRRVAAHRRPAADLCAAAVLVRRSARAQQLVVQHPVRVSSARSARRGRARGESSRDRRSARDPANPLPVGGRTPAPGHRSGQYVHAAASEGRRVE